LIAILVLFFFWRIVTPRLEDRATFPPGDFTDQFWMFRVYQARAFAQGRLPLWSDNFNSGHPFLADVQSAIFYPVSLIWTLAVVAMRGANFTLFDLELEAIFHFILAGAFTYLFAKRLLGSRIAALVSALTFTFGGYLTSYPPQQLAILETATWLPLILLLLDYAIERGLRYYLLAGVMLGIAALAGHPQTFLFVGYASVIYFAYRVYQTRKAHPTPRFTFYALRFVLVVLSVTGIASAQLIPSMEYQTVSTRATLAWSEAARGFPTLDPLQMILPGYASAFQSPLYIGIFPLWLALFALFVNRSREKIFWIALAFGALIVSFGFYVFAYALFYLFVPGFALFRGQERLALIVSFALAMLAGYGARDLWQATFDAKRARRAWALLPMGSVVSALMLFTMYIAARDFQTGRLFFLTDRAALMVLIFILTTLLVGWQISFSHRARTFSALAVALLLFDLFSINTAGYNAEPQERFPVSSLIATMQNDAGIFRVVDEGTQPGHFGIAYDLQEIGGISPLKTKWYEAVRTNVPAETAWQLLNVRFVLTERPDLPNAELVAQAGKTRLFKLQNEMPRAWLVGAAQLADDATALAAMQNQSFDPRAIVYLADAPAFSPAPNAVLTTVAIEQREPEDFTLTFSAPTDAILVLSHPFYPGWHAIVDGNDTPILRADIALQAIAVRAGTHRVEMRFDPWTVKAGIALTISTLIAIASIFLATVRRTA
jgi:uncharacterized membrane protein YfhO